MKYTAKQGDIIWIDFDPQTGHEQARRRPALVVSNDSFNNLIGYGAMVCPITNTDRGVSLHPELDSRTKTTGFIMCDQAKILDISNRNAKYVEKAPSEMVYEVVDIITGFIEVEDQ